ncbi:MAG: hypothetical protein U9P90_04145 [Patescibacteria group bacterium]|nr:hypothetical protein [Patescibacteria group bacterium]
MMTKNQNYMKNIVNIILLLIGVSLCVFAIIFLVTGMDEIWNGHTLWVRGIGIFGLSSSIGLASIMISISEKKRAPKAFRLIIISFFLISVLSSIIS